MSSPAAPAMGTHFDSAKAWVSAIGAALVVMASFGTIYAFGVFAEDMAAEFDTGLGPVSVVTGVTVFLFFGCALLSGRLYDRFGIAPLLLVGGAMFSGGLVATSQVSVLWHGYVLFGIGLGFGGGLFNAPLFALTATWFNRFRAVAQGVVATGSGLGTMGFPLFAQFLMEQVGWRGGMRWLAVVCGAVFFLGLILVSRPPAMRMGEPKRHVRLVVRTRAFWQMGFAGICFTVAVIGTLGLIVAFAEEDGVPDRAATVLIAVVGLASIIGRLALTSLARPLGSIRLLKTAFFGLPIAYATWYVATRIDVLETKYVVLIAFAVVLGVSYGGFVALLGDVTAHLFGLVGIGAVVGLLFFFTGTGALVGPPLMGYTKDLTGGIVASILLVGAISSVGVVILLPMTRHPIGLPTYIGPGGPPPPAPVAAAGAAPTAPTVAAPAAGKADGKAGLQPPAAQPARPPAPALAGASDGLRNGESAERAIPRLVEIPPPGSPLHESPPEVFWPVPAESADAG